MAKQTKMIKGVGIRIVSSKSITFTNCTRVNTTQAGLDISEFSYPFELTYGNYTRHIRCGEECRLSTMLEF